MNISNTEMLNVNDPMFEEWVQNIIQQESDFSENDDSDKDLPRGKIYPEY